MKLAFSTLGCPDWTVEQAIKAAVNYGFQGIELRGIDGELDILKLHDFSNDHIGRTRALFENAGIDVVCIDSSASFSWREPAKISDNIKEAMDYISLAEKLGAPFVRVFGDRISEGVIFADAARQLADCLIRIGDFAREKGVTVALETHGSYLTGKEISEVMEMTQHQSVGVIWDVSNSFWTGEPIEDTAKHIAPYLKHVHIKDSVWDGNEAKLTFIGEGDVPNVKVLKILTGQGYSGYLSYEWEKRWQPDLPEPEEAFPQYAKKMKEYLSNCELRIDN